MNLNLKKVGILFFVSLLFSKLSFSNNTVLFEENNGQVKLKSVLFEAKLPGLCIWIGEKGITYNFYKVITIDSLTLTPFQKKANTLQIDWFRSEMLLKNANISTKNLLKKNKTQFTNSYLKANNTTTTHLFEELYFTNVYEGIDWRLYIENNQIKQEFIVQPFANPNLINLQYVSTGNIDVKEKEIKLTNALGVFTEGKLLCYQTNQNNIINANYVYSKQFKKINNTTINYYDVKINTKKYDNSKPLVIDPILQWSTFYGGSADEDAHTIYSDGVNTWVAGHSLSFNFPTQDPGFPSFYQGSNSGGFGDAFISKFSANGNLLWSTYFGGTGSDEALSIFSNGTNVWVGGFTNSTNFPVLNPGAGAFFQSTLTALSDAFILKFNTNGQLLWSTYCGGINSEYIAALHVNNNELYVGATSNSSNYPFLSSGTFTQSYLGGNDGVVMKFNANNNLVWSTFIGGTGNDIISGIQTNSTSIFISGYTNSTNYNLLNAGGGAYYQSTLGGSFDGFITKFSLSGVMQSSTYFGGSGNDRYNGLTLNNDFLWLVGTTTSTNLPVLNPGGGAFYQGTVSAFGEIFLNKFDLAGVLKWSTYYGGNLDDFGISITGDGKNVFVGGYTNSNNNFTLNPGNASFFQGTSGGFYEALILQFDSASICKWASYFGGNSNDYINALHCDVNKIYVTGYTQSVSFPLLNPGSGAYYVTTNTGGLEAFVTKFNNCNNPVPIATVNTPLCIGAAINFTANTFFGASYQWFGPLGFTDFSQYPVIPNATASNAGNYTLITSLPGGCASATSVSVTVNNSPTVSINSPTAICLGDNLVLNGSTASSYSWTGVSSFTSSIQNPTIAATSTLNAGVYNLLVSNAFGCTNSTSLNIIVNPLPIAFALSTNSSVCIGTNINLIGSGGVLYSWTGPFSFSSNVQNQTINNVNTLQQGYYVLTVTDANNCKKSDSTFVAVSVCTSINQKDNSVGLINLYPNPAINEVNVTCKLPNINSAKILILNMEGKRISSQNYSPKIAVDALPAGLYLLKIEIENKEIYKEKFLKINN